MADQASDLPPYTAFTSFWTFVEELNQRGPLPQVLDRQMFAGRSNASAYELTQALRSLGVVDQDKRPTPQGREFLTDPSPDRLRALLANRYPEALALGLDTATVGQLTDVLKGMGLKESSATLRKARTFFLQAAEKAGIAVGPHLRVSAPRSQRPARRSRQALATNGTRPPDPTPPDLVTQYVQLLMEKVRDQDRPDDGLLDRIERALKVPKAPTLSAPED